MEQIAVIAGIARKRRNRKNPDREFARVDADKTGYFNEFRNFRVDRVYLR